MTVSEKRLPWITSRTKTSNRLVLGGVLAIVAGFLAVGEGSLYLVGVELLGDPLGGALALCGTGKIISGIVSIAGGMLAINRTNWRLSFVCSFFGILGIGFAIGAFVGGIGMVIIAVSRQDFKRFRAR